MNSSPQERTEKADWTPTPETIYSTNIAWLMQRVGVDSYEALHRWSVQHREEFWAAAIARVGIALQKNPDRIADLSAGIESPRWLPGAKLNIAESCFTAPADSPAIISQPEGGAISTMSYGELAALAGRVAANLRRLGYRPGAALAILMPMTAESVAVYLGIVAAGCVVVGIADSFRPPEIATRLRLADAVGVFTQDVLLRGGKILPLYENAIEANAPRTIVLPAGEHLALSLRDTDCAWEDFLQGDARLEFTPREPADPMNILFSSGTTGDPKAIPWTHTTPIKCAVDAHFHQDVHPGDVLVWPTNLGWMMGPWVIFGALVNRATIGLYYGAPTGREFGGFVQNAKATVLGVVPSLVKTWRKTGCMDEFDWSALKLFTSTGECSSADDMRWLMQRAGGKPVIEYCGGTEIGGAYISGTLTRPCVAGTFNTPALGLDVVIFDLEGKPAASGELFLVPPSVGLSNSLLNKDHHQVYFASTPRGPAGEVLRRHGDEMEALPGGYWRPKGRADDTMNLGGIKVSSAEIERVLQKVPGVFETAAIAVAPDDGPSQLVIYAVCHGSESADKDAIATAMQAAIKRDLNPLFKIHDLVLVEALPRTASNKIMRRELRAQYGKTS
jgi:acetyl-CoA synthetase